MCYLHVQRGINLLQAKAGILRGSVGTFQGSFGMGSTEEWLNLESMIGQIVHASPSATWDWIDNSWSTLHFLECQTSRSEAFLVYIYDILYSHWHWVNVQ